MPHATSPEAATQEQREQADARTNIEAAYDFHRELALKRRNHVTWTISGAGVTTDIHIVAYYPEETFEGFRTISIDEQEVEAGRSDDGDGTVPLWSATARLPERPTSIAARVSPGVCNQYRSEGVEHDKMCAAPEVIATLKVILDHVLHAPNNVIGASVLGLVGRLERMGRMSNPLADARDRKSAEIELRVARWFADDNHAVYVLEEPADSVRRADLNVDGASVDVKAFGPAPEPLVRAKIREALQFQAKSVVVVRLEGANLSLEEMKRIAAEEEADFNDATVVVLEEAVLPEIRWD